MRPMICYALAILAIGFAGCTGTVKSVEQQIQDAISRLEGISGNWTDQSNTWRNTLINVSTDLTKAGQTTLANEVQNVANRSIQATGIEFRCDVDFVRSRMISDLKALKAAIVGKKDKVDWSPPTVCNWSPSVVDLNLEPARRNHLEFAGYDLYNLSDHPTGLKLELVNTAGAKTDVSQFLAKPTIYQGVVDLGGAGIQFGPDSRRLVLTWQGATLSEIAVIQPPPPLPDPPPPQITSVVIRVDTTDDDKDREITFTYQVHKPGVGAIGSVAAGGGTVWPNPSTRTFTIPFENGRTFPEAERAQWALRVNYDSSNGDPRWIGKVSATATVSYTDAGRHPATRTIDVLADTGNFEMGHAGGHQMRDFMFNR